MRLDRLNHEPRKWALTPSPPHTPAFDHVDHGIFESCVRGVALRVYERVSDWADLCRAQRDPLISSFAALGRRNAALEGRSSR